MTIPFLFDVHVHRAIATALRRKGVDVVTAQEDGSDRRSDADLLDRATSLGRVLVTYDPDLLAEAHRRQRDGVAFAGIAYAPLQRVTVRSMVEDLLLLSEVMTPAEIQNRVEFLPL